MEQDVREGVTEIGDYRFTTPYATVPAPAWALGRAGLSLSVLPSEFESFDPAVVATLLASLAGEAEPARVAAMATLQAAAQALLAETSALNEPHRPPVSHNHAGRAYSCAICGDGTVRPYAEALHHRDFVHATGLVPPQAGRASEPAATLVRQTAWDVKRDLKRAVDLAAGNVPPAAGRASEPAVTRVRQRAENVKRDLKLAVDLAAGNVPPEAGRASEPPATLVRQRADNVKAGLECAVDLAAGTVPPEAGRASEPAATLVRQSAWHVKDGLKRAVDREAE